MPNTIFILMILLVLEAYKKSSVKIIRNVDYHKIGTNNVGFNGTYNYGITHLIITNSTSNYEPEWYKADTIRFTNVCIDYINRKYIIRDSRLNNATDKQIHLIAKEYSNKNNHYVFIYSPETKTIWIREQNGVQFFLVNADGKECISCIDTQNIYNTGYLAGYEMEVFGQTIAPISKS